MKKHQPPLPKNLLIRVSPRELAALKKWLDKPLLPFFNIISHHPLIGEIKVEFEAPPANKDLAKQ